MCPDLLYSVFTMEVYNFNFTFMIISYSLKIIALYRKFPPPIHAALVAVRRTDAVAANVSGKPYKTGAGVDVANQSDL